MTAPARQKYKGKKIVALGPVRSGKSVISNFLADQADVEFVTEYRPTKAARIVEFESHELDLRDHRVEIDIELWDCSGDIKYQDCWPAVKEGLEGVILIANPDENQGKDLEIWYNEFISKTGLPLSNVLVILNEMGEKRTNDGAISDFRLPSVLSGVRCSACNLRNEGASLKMEFNIFLSLIVEKSIFGNE